MLEHLCIYGTASTSQMVVGLWECSCRVLRFVHPDAPLRKALTALPRVQVTRLTGSGLIRGCRSVK